LISIPFINHSITHSLFNSQSTPQLANLKLLEISLNVAGASQDGIIIFCIIPCMLSFLSLDNNIICINVIYTCVVWRNNYDTLSIDRIFIYLFTRGEDNFKMMDARSGVCVCMCVCRRRRRGGEGVEIRRDTLVNATTQLSGGSLVLLARRHSYIFSYINKGGRERERETKRDSQTIRQQQSVRWLDLLLIS